MPIILGLGFACSPYQSINEEDYYDEKSIESWMHEDNPLVQQQQNSARFSKHTSTTENRRETLRTSQFLMSGNDQTPSIGEEDEKAGKTNMTGVTLIKSTSANRNLDEMSGVSWDE